MADPQEVATQVRFGLSQLRARNGHHDFEALCRYLARVGICENILPATGPVAAGGDQGRDFETFRSHLRDTRLSSPAFLGKIEQRALVFACSLQLDDLPGKIRADTRKIVASGIPVEGVYFFLAEDLPVAKRHDVQTWARSELDISLEVLDGQALSELLAQPDNFWIAERYLAIPSEMCPTRPPEKVGRWYLEAKAKWSAQTEPDPMRLGDFTEIKSAIRHATFTEGLRSDVPLWTSRLAVFAASEFQHLRRRAVYEIAVASLRGLNTLSIEDHGLDEYFLAIPDLSRLDDLEDARVLLQFAYGARVRNILSAPNETLERWKTQLTERLDSALAEGGTAEARCRILECRGGIPFLRATPVTDDAAAECMKYWVPMADELDGAPLFPVERFADYLTILVPALAGHKDFSRLSQRVDETLARRAGLAVAADKCRDRAMAFLDCGKVLPAIRQLHAAKIQWFSGETVRGSLLAMTVLSTCYGRLGLHLAAKYYALAAACLALRREDDSPQIAPHALFAAAIADHGQGAWIGSLAMLSFAMRAHFSLSEEPWDEKHEAFGAAMLHATVESEFTLRFVPDNLVRVKAAIEHAGLAETVATISADGDGWAHLPNDELLERAEEDLIDRPFSDAGATRTIRFRASGLSFSVAFENSYDAVPAAEQFVAVAQIIVADLAEQDLCLIPGDVVVELEVEEISEPRIRSEPTNDIAAWRVSLPSRGSPGDIYRQIAAVVVTILAEASALPVDAFRRAIEECFESGLEHKLLFGSSYELAFREIMSKEEFAALGHRDWRSLEVGSFGAREHPELAWPTSAGPGYSKEQAMEFLENRYRKFAAPIRDVLERLRASRQFMDLVAKLRDEGWLDWHILGAVSVTVLNYRLSRAVVGTPTPEQLRVEGDRLIREGSADTLPLAIFSERALRETRVLNMLATLGAVGLENRRRAPNIRGVEKLLATRFAYWTDDVEHEPLF